MEERLGITCQHVALKCLVHLKWYSSHISGLPSPDNNNNLKNTNPYYLECFLIIMISKHLEIKRFLHGYQCFCVVQFLYQSSFPHFLNGSCLSSSSLPQSIYLYTVTTKPHHQIRNTVTVRATTIDKGIKLRSRIFDHNKVLDPRTHGPRVSGCYVTLPQRSIHADT